MTEGLKPELEGIRAGVLTVSDRVAGGIRDDARLR
jgi:hypothetical protein